MQQANWDSYLTGMSWYIPGCLLLLVGIVLALINLGRHTIPAMLALIAFGLQSANLVIIAGTMAWHMQIIPHEAADRGAPVLMLLRAVQTMLGVMSQLLILAAIFGWRHAPPIPATLVAKPIGNSKPE